MKRKLAQMSLRVDDKLRRDFRIKCIALGVSSTKRIADLISADVEGRLTIKKK